MLARLLAEYFHSESRPVAAFDANPDNFTLVDYLPAYTAVATLNDVRGEVALFDQLIANDRVAKVVDLEPALFDRFFGVMQNIDFLREASRAGVAPVALFMADADRRSSHGYAVLHERLPELALMPVFNEAVPGMARCRDAFPPTRRGQLSLAMPQLSPVIRTVVERQTYSFASYMRNATDPTSELYGWVRQMFVQFREIELRMVLEDMKPSLEEELRRLSRRR